MGREQYRMRSGSGLGDNLYLQSIARHISKTLKLVIPTDHPEIFLPLENVKTAKRSKVNIDIIAHYVQRKGHPGTSQFDDMCWSAGKSRPVKNAGIKLVDEAGKATIDYRNIWKIQNNSVVDRVKTAQAIHGHGRPLMLVSLPRSPMARTDKFAAEVAPNWERYQLAVSAMASKYFLVQIGTGTPSYRLKGLDLDLANKTSESEMMDLAFIADAFIAGGSGFFIPLAEGFDKPGLIVWSGRGFRSKEPFISRITPFKVFHKPCMGYVVDEWDDHQLLEVARQHFQEK